MAMRWLLRCGLLLGIAGGTYPVPAIAAELADGPGCIGVMAEECVRWLRATMTLNENFLVGAMAHRHDTDVNGRGIDGGLVTVYAQLPGSSTLSSSCCICDRTIRCSASNLTCCTICLRLTPSGSTTRASFMTSS